jgi:rod shape-determining protein MreC
VAAFGTGGIRSQGRGASPGPRFTVYAIISILVMFYDQRHGWLEAARFFLTSTIAYPVQAVVNSPTSVWHWLQESFESRDALRAENERLKAQDRVLAIRAMRFDALERENAELRGLRDDLPPLVDHWIPAEIMNVEVDSLRQRVVINRGTTNGVFKAQTVIDDKGVIGQTTHVGLLSSEVILITDPEHAIPVQVERTGLRTIAVGAGDTVSLALPYLPGNADLKPGDILLTSGLGGVFPAGYPVAKVAEVHRDAVQPLAQVRATPLADIESDREVALVWFREDNPAAPTPAANEAGDLSKGNSKLKPQPAPPPKPKPAPAEAAPGTGAPQTTPGATPAKAPPAGPAAGGANTPSRTPSNPAAPAAGGSTATPAPKKPVRTAPPAQPTPQPPAPSPDATPRTP